MRSLTTRSMITPAALCGSLLASGFLAAPSMCGTDETPTGKEIEEAGELFGSSCASCHLPPNPDHATDRAWLQQVTDTA